MIYIHTLEEKQRLLFRDESRLKSFDSCVDLRSWSHDHERRSQYLREWMKADLPIRVFSGQKLGEFLYTMTCKSRRKLAPRCHPDCKSKLLLDSICNSCSAMQECLKRDKNLNSLYQEEEFETCYWPCERCLDVLKNIKVFWKVILEKIFNFKVPKTGEFGDSSHKVYRSDTVHSVAKMWEKELIQQAMFVNKIMPMLKKTSKDSKTLKTNCSSSTKQNQTVGDFIVLHKSSPQSSLLRKQTQRKKVNRGTTAKIKMADNEANTSDIESDEILLYKYNIEYLQKRFNHQENEISALKKENNSLKLELDNFYDNVSWKTPFTNVVKTKGETTAAIVDSNTALPKPFECCADTNNENLSHGIDSEVIITMRDCKNENFKHVSLLQVLHKTNEPIGILGAIKEPCHTKQNPVELLTKVRNAFGELVEREMNVVMRAVNKSQSKITASFCKVNISKSEPSCSTIDFTKISISNSDTHFYSL